MKNCVRLASLKQLTSIGLHRSIRNLPHPPRGMKKEESQNQKIDIDIGKRTLQPSIHRRGSWWIAIRMQGIIPGSDDIQYEFLKKLDRATRLRLLSMYEKIRTEGVFPKEWRGAIVISILKPGKNPAIAASYRPISLTIQCARPDNKQKSYTHHRKKKLTT
jgi:hypothetical protein